MTAALMLLPLILAVLDEILRAAAVPRPAGGGGPGPPGLRPVLPERGAAGGGGPAHRLLRGRPRRGGLRGRPGAASAGCCPTPAAALGVGAVVGGVLLAYPVLFALAGPAHLSGAGLAPHRHPRRHHPLAVGRPRAEPHPAASSPPTGATRDASFPRAAISGWGLIVVLVGGTAVWFRDRRLWFYGLLLAPSAWSAPSTCAPALGAGPALRPHPAGRQHPPPALHGRRFPGRRRHGGPDPGPRPHPPARRLTLRRRGGTWWASPARWGWGRWPWSLWPSTSCRTCRSPWRRWCCHGGTPRWPRTCRPGRVLLSYPVPFSGIQVAWPGRR